MPVEIEEKPMNAQSDLCVIGLYIYSNNVVEYARFITPSRRGELEITDVNKQYLLRNKLKLEVLDKSVIWIDAGTSIEFVSDRPGHDLRYAINAEKIRNELGWFPLISFSDGLDKTISWYLKNEKWWSSLK